MKILCFVLAPALLLPLLASDRGTDDPVPAVETSRSLDVPNALDVPVPIADRAGASEFDEMTPRWLTADEIAFGDTLCDCPIGQVPIKGVIFRIRANNCYILDTPCTGTPTAKVVVKGTIPGNPQVGDKVAICGTLNTAICNTNYDGYDIVDAAIITSCDDCL